MIGWFLAIILLVLLIWSIIKTEELKDELRKLEREFDRRVAEESNKLAQKMYTEWINTKLKEIEKQIREKYQVEFEKYKEKWEKEVRRDAIERSVSVVLGRISEHLAPLIMIRELGVNPKDFRYLGTPVDYIAFKGLSDGKPEEIIFIEVKASKTGALSSRELKVKKLVEAKKVRWVTLNLNEFIREARSNAAKEVEQILSGELSRESIDAKRALEELLEKLK